MAARNWLGVALVLQIVLVVTLVSFGEGRPNICVGEGCKKHEPKTSHLDVLGAYCLEICYGNVVNEYNQTCHCEQIVTTPPPPCTATYLQTAVCDWSTRSCNNSEYCEWRKELSNMILSSQKIEDSCDCPLKEEVMKDPCHWEESERTLCSILKVNQVLYDDFQCVCNVHPPAPPPETTDVCKYTQHRPAQLIPSRERRLFAGNAAHSCNYPGVVGLLGRMATDFESLCTATLLSEDTILFDQQCKAVLKDHVYALVNSYDSRAVNSNSPTVDITSIQPVGQDGEVNALFTAKLSTKVVTDDKCVQPACLPNVRTPAHHINLDDCRVLGYGETADGVVSGSQPSKLQEIHVKVVDTSVTSDLLEVTRDDGYYNTACLNEFSAPLVCSHKSTKEWITVGIHQSVGVVCSGKATPKTFKVANLLRETRANHYYHHLKSFQPNYESSLPE